MRAVVVNLDWMGNIVFQRLIIVSWLKDCKFYHVLILWLVSFPSIALNIFIVYNFTCNYGACFIKMVPFLLHRSSLGKQIVIFSQMSLDTNSVPFFSFMKLGNISVKWL